MSSIPGIGLVLDADASSARREGHFFDLATARGDQLVMLEGAYADSLEKPSTCKPLSIRMMAYMGIYSSELSEYGLQPVAVDEKTDVRL